MKKIILLVLVCCLPGFSLGMQSNDKESEKLYELFKKMNTQIGNITIKNAPLGGVKNIFISHVMPFFPINDKWVTLAFQIYKKQGNSTKNNVLSSDVKWTKFIFQLLRETHIHLTIVSEDLSFTMANEFKDTVIHTEKWVTEENCKILRDVFKNIHVEVIGVSFELVKDFKNEVELINFTQEDEKHLGGFFGCENIACMMLQFCRLSKKNLERICDSFNKKLRILFLSEVGIDDDITGNCEASSLCYLSKLKCLKHLSLVGEAITPDRFYVICKSVGEFLRTLHTSLLYGLDKYEKFGKGLSHLKKANELIFSGVGENFAKNIQNNVQLELRNKIKRLTLIIINPYPRISFEKAKKLFPNIEKKHYHSMS